MNLNKLNKISGDASFRVFYRKKNSILVYCKKEKKINLEVYDAINKILTKNKILAPKIINQKFTKDFIEIEDFGDETVYKKFNKKGASKIKLYKKILKLLCKIQKVKTRKIKTFLGNSYKIPDYTNDKLIKESNLFLEWYLPKFIKKNKKKKIQKEISRIYKILIHQLTLKRKVFVHRDFHISNIMLTTKGLGLIDNQDSIFGNLAYDLASLVDDVRIKTNLKTKNFIINEFLKMNRSIDYKNFKNDFEILSVMRNLKIIGIFSRLSIRDRKHKYLKLIPRAWQLIELRTKNNPKFKDLMEILDTNFNITLRKKYAN